MMSMLRCLLCTVARCAIGDSPLGRRDKGSLLCGRVMVDKGNRRGSNFGAQVWAGAHASSICDSKPVKTFVESLTPRSIRVVSRCPGCRQSCRGDESVPGGGEQAAVPLCFDDHWQDPAKQARAYL